MAYLIESLECFYLHGSSYCSLELKISIHVKQEIYIVLSYYSAKENDNYLLCYLISHFNQDFSPLF